MAVLHRRCRLNALGGSICRPMTRTCRRSSLLGQACQRRCGVQSPASSNNDARPYFNSTAGYSLGRDGDLKKLRLAAQTPCTPSRSVQRRKSVSHVKSGGSDFRILHPLRSFGTFPVTLGTISGQLGQNPELEATAQQPRMHRERDGTRTCHTQIPTTANSAPELANIEVKPASGRRKTNGDECSRPPMGRDGTGHPLSAVEAGHTIDAPKLAEPARCAEIQKRAVDSKTGPPPRPPDNSRPSPCPDAASRNAPNCHFCHALSSYPATATKNA